MNKIEIPRFKLIGLKIGNTSNKNGQSSIDCGNLWQRFEQEGLAERISGRLGDEIYAVYFNYEGDHTEPFSYFVGCRVGFDAAVPEGLESLAIPAQTYSKYTAKGTMPDCITNQWKAIWRSDQKRNYQYDFEVYDERSSDWSNAEVDLFVS